MFLFYRFQYFLNEDWFMILNIFLLYVLNELWFMVLNISIHVTYLNIYQMWFYIHDLFSLFALHLEDHLLFAGNSFFKLHPNEPDCCKMWTVLLPDTHNGELSYDRIFQFVDKSM